MAQVHFRFYMITLANGNDSYGNLLGICRSMTDLFLISLTSQLFATISHDFQTEFKPEYPSFPCHHPASDCPLFFYIYLFGCARSQLWHSGSFIVACELLSSCGAWVSLQLRHAGSLVVALGLSSCGAQAQQFPDQGPNPSPLNQKVNSQPLDHQGSPCLFFINKVI